MLSSLKKQKSVLMLILCYSWDCNLQSRCETLFSCKCNSTPRSKFIQRNETHGLEIRWLMKLVEFYEDIWLSLWTFYYSVVIHEMHIATPYFTNPASPEHTITFIITWTWSYWFYFRMVHTFHGFMVAGCNKLLIVDTSIP